MCTLAVAFQTDRRWPVIVAANRDERLGRPSESWALRDGRGGARKRRRATPSGGGTWIGLSRRGVFGGAHELPRAAELVPGSHPALARRDRAARARGRLPRRRARRLAALDARAGTRSTWSWRTRRSAFLWWYDGERRGARAARARAARRDGALAGRELPARRPRARALAARAGRAGLRDAPHRARARRRRRRPRPASTAIPPTAPARPRCCGSRGDLAASEL